MRFSFFALILNHFSSLRCGLSSNKCSFISLLKTKISMSNVLVNPAPVWIIHILKWLVLMGIPIIWWTRFI